MPLSPEHLVRRRPLWAALSDLFLDTETRWFVPRVALACAESRYDDAQLEQVFWAEVFPLAVHNLHDIAGEWALLELPEDELLARADANSRDVALETRSAWMVRERWRTALTLCQRLRATPEQLRLPLTRLWEVFAKRWFEDVGRKLTTDPAPQLHDARDAGLDCRAEWPAAQIWLLAMSIAEERTSAAARATEVERMLRG